MPEHSVLLIDDDLDALRTIGKYFERLGYTVHQARSGKEGVRAWQRFEPDVTILDLLLPDMSGREAGQAVVTTPPFQDTLSNQAPR